MQQVAGNIPTCRHTSPKVPIFFHTPLVPEHFRSMHGVNFTHLQPCKAYVSATTAPFTIDRKLNQVHSDLFSCSDSIFAVRFSIQNLDMLGDEISLLIHVIFYGDNFAQ